MSFELFSQSGGIVSFSAESLFESAFKSFLFMSGLDPRLVFMGVIVHLSWLRNYEIATQKAEQENFPQPGFEKWSYGNKSQCATNELL